MDNGLIVCSSQKGVAFYEQLLGEYARLIPASANSGAAARRLFIDNDYDLVVIHGPLTDEYGTDLAISATERTTAGVLLVVKNEMADEISEKVEDYGVIVVQWPLNRLLFCQALKIAAASRRRMLGLKTKNVQLQHQLEDMRLIDRAKCALIAHCAMTENQAHKYIEKQAMDKRVSKRTVAEAVLSTYEDI